VHTHTQRAEANRLLKEVEKRLMIAKDLMPASPLIPSASCRPPLPPANMEGRARLVERKMQLEVQVGGCGCGCRYLDAVCRCVCGCAHVQCRVQMMECKTSHPTN